MCRNVCPILNLHEVCLACACDSVMQVCMFKLIICLYLLRYLTFMLSKSHPEINNSVFSKAFETSWHMLLLCGLLLIDVYISAVTIPFSYYPPTIISCSPLLKN